MASLTHWDPMTDIASLREEVNRIFGRKMGAAIGGHWVPPMDILDTAEAVIAKAELPGMKVDDIGTSISHVR